MENKINIKSEDLAYWYFRLNGFLTIRNFVVHPDSGREQRTEVDILGVRFPYRAELLENSMPDDEVFTKVKDKPYIIIVEVKRQTCNLNRYWRKNPERKGLNRIIRGIGAFKSDLTDNEFTDRIATDRIAQKLYEEGTYENDYYISLFCLGNQKNRELEKSHPNIPQKTWDEILKFIYNRFMIHKPQKSAHNQWDSQGRQLWSIFFGCNNENEFINKIIID